MASLLTSSAGTCILLVHFVFFSTASMATSDPPAPRSHLKTYAHNTFPDRIPRMVTKFRQVNRGHQLPKRSRLQFDRWVERMRISSDHPMSTFDAQERSIFIRQTDYTNQGTILYVDINGAAEYSNIQDAVDQVPDDNTVRVTIFIGPGVYEEKVAIPNTKPYITLQGAGMNQTVITWHDNAASGSTLMSASVIVSSNHFIARDISFRNSVGPPNVNSTGMQAAAFRISGDKAFLYRCGFYGFQDTLYDHIGRHYYLRCIIEGSEDFIFGYARSLFERCWLHSNAQGNTGAVAAQGNQFPDRNLDMSGFSFLRCSITGSGMPYLGRAWGQYSSVVYSYCEMDANINPAGWYDWGLRQRDETVFFGEYRCTGIGANTSRRANFSRVLTPEEAQPFLGIEFVNGPW